MKREIAEAMRQIEWKPIPGYPGYQVSNSGLVRSVDRTIIDKLGRKRRLRGKILRPSADRVSGHLSLSLCVNGLKQEKYVHRLVAAAWLGPCPADCEVRHGQNGVSDNSVSNLCYGTASENALDKRRDGTENGRRVVRSDGVEYASMAAAAEDSGCAVQNIWAACAGRRLTAGGFGWSYYEG